MHFEWISINYARCMAGIMMVYSILRFGHMGTYLIPKIPATLSWRRVFAITAFFIITGHLMHPYCVQNNIRIHIYSYLVSIEAFIWYSADEFHFVPSFLESDPELFEKFSNVTVHAKKK
ncbi:unnamed protein product [Caenorhabditis sp. 36 PRJEB53466]|nr:unnamed protein product [Caenorhabditis sp. 36 PRJEB53466]